MPVIFEKDIDRSELAINIAKALFKKYDYNEGQRSIVNSANYRANVIQHVEGDVQGNFWTYTSKITTYQLDIQVSHPEAIDETLPSVLEDTKSYIQELFDETEYRQVGELSDLAREHNSEFAGVLREVGLFV